MSYILDALKKSERQRQQFQPQSQARPSEGSPVEPGRQSRWPAIVLLALAANGLVLYTVLRAPRESPLPEERAASPAIEAPAPGPASPSTGLSPATAASAARSAAVAPPQFEGAPEVAELPLSVQQDLPPLVLSLHSWVANPAERKVTVNGRLLHEGQEVAAGLLLEQVTPTGAVFTFHGYRFRMRLF